jgi:hypothetical protein
VAEINEGEERGAAAGGEKENGGAAIVNGEVLASDAQSSVTELHSRIREYRGKAEEKASPAEHSTRAETVSRGARHGRR